MQTRKEIAREVSAGSLRPGSSVEFRNRRNDHRQTYFRAGRYFTIGHEWYVTLREGDDMGPYPDRDVAEMALAMRVAGDCVESPGGIARLFGNNEECASLFEIMVREMADGLEQRKLRSDNCAYVWARQRLDELYRHPAQQTHPVVRSKALNYLLYQMEK